MLLADVVATSAALTATPSRTAKVRALADLLLAAGPEVGLAARYLAGQLRQERIDVGWRLVSDVTPPPAEAPSLALGEVDAAFAQLAEAAGPGSRGLRRTVLGDLLGRATAAEQEFLGALVLGGLRQGALAGIVAQAIAVAAGAEEPAVRRALMLSADLGAVAEAALAGELGRFALTLFAPLLPMLASTAESVTAALAGMDGAVVEWKLDGTRVQVHRDGDQVRAYSRLLRDVTARSGAIVAAVRDLDVTAIVLDGEALLVGADGRPAAFQDTVRADAAVQPFFFDVLHLDGRDLLDEPLAVRTAVLERVVPAAHRVPRAVVTDAAAGDAFSAGALAAGHEGVVVKDLAAPYEAGRRGAAWRKVKPVRTLDLVVLAVEEGSGRRRGWLSNIWLGARDGDGFVMLGKTFKGMTDEVLAWQTARFRELEVRQEGHVVHVRPEQVVEIALDGVQRSTRYPGGVALRFARVVRYRGDKAPSEADTLATVQALLERPAP